MVQFSQTTFSDYARLTEAECFLFVGFPGWIGLLLKKWPPTPKQVVILQTFFIFNPKIGEMIHFDLAYFSDGLVETTN